MTTHTLAPSAPAAHVAATAATDRVHLNFLRIVNAEWIKLRTLRSTIWTLAATLVVIVGIVTLSAVAAHGQGHGAGVGPAFFMAAIMAQLAVAVLGVLVVTGEYSTGMIRSTLAAVPQRLPALWAKGCVLAVLIFVISAVAVGLSLLSMQLILGGDGSTVLFFDSPDTIRVLVGIPLYLTAIALLSFAIGAMIRHSAGALATVMGLLLVFENLFQIPWKPLQYIGPLLPSTAGSKILRFQEEIDAMAQESAIGPDLSAWQGYGVLMIWIVVLLGLAAVLLKRRDA